MEPKVMKTSFKRENEKQKAYKNTKHKLDYNYKLQSCSSTVVYVLPYEGSGDGRCDKLCNTPTNTHKLF